MTKGEAVESSPPTICIVGDLVTDTVVHLDRDPRRGTDTPASVRHVRGGSAANVAVAVTQAGGRARFGGRVGDDDRGTRLVEELQAAGVDTAVQQVGRTGSIVVLVDPAGERSFLTDRGACVGFNMAATEVLAGMSWLHVPGYGFAAGPLAETVHQLLGEAVDQAIPTSIATSSVAFLQDFGCDQFMALIQTLRPNVVIANEAEATLLMGKGAATAALPGANWTVVTRGSKPTTVTRADGWSQSLSPKAIPSGALLDSTGAGDAFTGGLLAGLVSGTPIMDALEAGHALAFEAVQVAGAQ